MSSGWFDHTEPSLSTSLQEKQGVQGAYALVRGGSSTSNLIEPTRTTTPQKYVARCGEICHMSLGWFKHTEPHRTYSNHNITEIVRYGEVCHMSSG